MTKTGQNISDFTGGDTLDIKYTVTDDNGIAVDLTNATVRWAMADSRGDTALISKDSSGSDVVLTDASNGKFTVTLNASDTEDKEGTFYHEAEVEDANGNISTVATGYITIEDDTV